MSENSNPGFPPRASQPQDRTDFDDYQPWRVWAEAPTFAEDQLPWKCIAAFHYLLEALDYIDRVHERGFDVVFQTPSQTEWRRRSDTSINDPAWIERMRAEFNELLKAAGA